MYKKYFISLPIGQKLLDRESWIRKAWGEIPYSYSQDNVDLSIATYLDLKVDKWDINKAWSEFQSEEPMISIEFIRGLEVKEFCLDNDITCVELSDLALLMEIDEGCLDIDYQLFQRLLDPVFEGSECFGFSDSYHQIKELSNTNNTTELLSKLENPS